MKHLKLETVLQRLKDSDNLIAHNSLMNTIEATVLDLLESNMSNWHDQFSTNKQSFYDALKTELPLVEDVLPLSNDSCLRIRYIASCEFERNTTDESSVGLGGKGWVSGIESWSISIEDICLLMADGSEIDLSLNKAIRIYLHTNLKIE
jgi:hypothetical protein